MVTERRAGHWPGYWRMNPETGESEWIEISTFPGIKPPATQVIETERPAEPEPISAPEITRALPPMYDIELAGRYNIPIGQFVSGRLLRELGLPPEERPPGWDIPFEQYLSWEQAKWLGFDVPEGSVVKMVPVAGEEPQFFVIPEPRADLVPATLRKDLEDTLRKVYPELFDPTASYGYSLDEIPAMVMEVLHGNMEDDYQAFVADLYDRVGAGEAERVLRMLGVTEEFVLMTLDYKEQEARVNDTIQDVFPDIQSLEEFFSFLETNWESFVETIQYEGASTEKRRLLEFMGYQPQEINQFFSTIRDFATVDGLRTLAIIDTLNQTAYDERGNYIGKYNPATKEFTRAPQENILKDFFDWTLFHSRMYWEQGEGFLLSVLPELFYPDIPEKKEERGIVERMLPESMIRFLDETNRQQRENYRWLYSQNKAEYDEWMKKHPELLAPVDFQEGAFQHPELLLDPRYYAYELANVMPFILTATAMAVATGGVGLPAVLGTAAIMAPIEGQAVYEDLINAGAPRDKAAQMAAVAGGIIALLESAGRIPLLKQVSPLLFGQFKKKVTSELAKRTFLEVVKKYGRNFTIAQFSEVSTEVAQEIVGNTAVSFYDENRSILENTPDIAVKTAVATIFPATFSAGVSMRMVRPSETAGLTDAQMKAKGWVQDHKGNWYERLRQLIRGEEGFIRLPGEPEAEITKSSWDAMTVEQKVARAKGAGLEGKVGSKAFEDLTSTEIERLSQAPAVPKAEPGMPEAGLQPPLIEGVPAREVRPEARAEIVQLSMEEQLRLEEARRAEQVSDLGAKLFEVEAEIESLQNYIDSERASKLTYLIKRTGRMKGELDNLTLKQFRGITGEAEIRPNILTPDGKHVMWEYALDEVASDLGYADSNTLAEAIRKSWQSKQRLTELKETRRNLQIGLGNLEAIKPVESLPEPRPEEIAVSPTGEQMLTPAQITRTLELFGRYVESPKALTAWELTRELRRETRAGQAELLKSRVENLIVSEGLSSEEAINQAIKEIMPGELPVMRTDYLADLTQRMRRTLFDKVYHTLQDEPFELMATTQALTNALLGRAIPRIPGPAGRSAFIRLQRVFGSQPLVLKALEKGAEQGKTLEDVVEGTYRDYVEGGNPPIPIDQDTADYLRNLATVPMGKAWLSGDIPALQRLTAPMTQEQIRAETERLRIELAKEPAAVTKFEAPIEAAFKQAPLMTFAEKQMVVRILKEAGLTAVDIGSFVRANMASFDMSFWRQQKTLIAGHPVSFYRANVEAFKALFSQKSAEANMQWIQHDPLYQLYDQINIDFLRPLEIGKGTARWRGVEEFGYLTEERLIPRLTAKIPWIKLSARAFVVGTNTHNWLVFKTLHQAALRRAEKIASGEIKLPEGEAFDITQEMTDYAKMLSDFTQRAQLGRVSGLAPALGGLFFAPRSKLGRLLTPRHLVSANPRVRAEAFKDLSLFVTAFGGLVMTGALLGLWDVETDPRNAEFMSIRIGNMRIDPWGGYRQFMVLYSRLLSGTGISSVTGAEYEVNPIGALTSFVRTSLAPLPSIILDFWTGKNFLGEKVDVAKPRQWAERIAPFSVQDMWDAFEDHWKLGAISILPAIFGEGVQTYTGDWVENFTKLGLPKYLENTAEGITQPYYDTADFWTDTSSQFKGVDPATLTEAKGFPPYIRSIAEARIINEHLSTLPSKKLVSLNADPGLDEPTFSEYRQMWADRQKLVASGDQAEFTVKELQTDGKYKQVTYKGDDALVAFDKKYLGAENGNFSQRQFSLLMQYHAMTDPVDQAEFLEKHKADIGINPRADWLRANTKENALLAVWGQAKILTKAAYTEFNRLIQELDIPDNAIPELTLPPETSIDTHFTYEEMVSEGRHGSVEAQLLLLKDHLAAEEAGAQSYVDWRTEGGNPLTLSGKTLEYLQLRVDNQELFDKLDQAREIEPESERDRTIREIRATKVGDETFRDIERRVDAMGKGTREAPIPDEVVDAFVDHMRIVDATSGNSPDAKLNRYDNPELNEFLMSEDYHGDQKAATLHEDKEYLDNYLVPRWRIDVQYRAEDAAHDAIPGEDTEARDGYLAGEGLEGEALARRVEYRQARRRREALSLSNKVTGERFPLDQIENFVGYWELSVKGKRQERFLVDNPDFAKAMHDIAGIHIPRPEDVPAVQYDDIYDEWEEQFEQLEGLSDHESPFYVEDVDARAVARNAMMFTTATQTYSGIDIKNKQLTAFGLAIYRREAYGKFVPEKYVNDYVDWKRKQAQGKPEDWKLFSGTDEWYEDDWFMMEHMEFYQDVYRDLLGNEKWDFRKVPTREVFDKYLIYINLPHRSAKDDYRRRNPDLDKWGVLSGKWTPISEKKAREGLTAYEIFLEEFAKRQEAIEEWLRKLRE